MQSEEVKHKAIRGVIALTWRTLFLQIVSFGAFFLLGIFLSPEAVGVFIAVSALLRIFTLFTDLGLGAALVQKKGELENDDLSTTFTLQTILVSTVVLVGLLSSKLVIRFSGLNSDGIFLYQVLLVTLLISSLKSIPSILLERKLAFEKQIIPQIVESLVFNFILVGLAYKGFGVAAYSWSILISSLIGLPIYYIVSPWRVSLKVDFSRARQLISYGISYQGKSVLAIFKDDLLTFFLTSLVGPSGIGYWGWAQRWAYSPFRLVVDSVTKVTFPAYARVQGEVDKLKFGIEKSLFAISLLLFPIFTLMAVLVPKLIYLLPKYTKWEPAITSFYFLCAGAAISALSGVLVNALDAIGKVKATLVLMIIWIVLGWVSTLILVNKFGFTGISIASFLVSLTIVLTISLLKRYVPFSFWGTISKPLLGVLVMISVIAIFGLNVGILRFSTGILLGGIGYIMIIILTARKELLALLQNVFSAYKK